MEWACEHLAFRLSRWAFIEVLEYVGKLSLLGALIAFIWDIPARRQAAEDTRKAKHYQAWQTINSALGQSGNGGRNDALQDLNNDRISLAGVDVSGAFLMDLDLRQASVQFARMTNVTFVRPNFANSYLWHVMFQESYFEDAKFNGAMLHQANFAEARFRRGDFSDDFTGGFAGNLSGSDLSESYFWAAQLAGVDFSKANLAEAMFMEANLTSARLAGSNLARATFWKANLFKTDFQQADLEGVDFELACLNGANLAEVTDWLKISSLKRANIYNVRNPPAGFIEWATNKMGAVSIPLDSYSAWTNWLTSAEKP